MKYQFDRQFVAQGLIAVAVCVGAWMMLVQPQSKELSKLEAEIEASTNATPTAALTAQQISDRMSEIRARVSHVLQLNHLASDSSRLYGPVMDLASHHQVQVRSLQPGQSQRAAGEAPWKATRIDLTVTGPYENVAAFIEDVCTIEAHLRPVSVMLTPTEINGKPAATALFGFDLLSFDIAESLAIAGGTSDGRP